MQEILERATMAGLRARNARRDFHQFPEMAYTEIRTGSKVARRLAELGYDVRVGRQVMTETSRFGMPTAAELEQHYERALADGADAHYAAQMRDGFTGVVGILQGGKPGPVVAVRIDMDALPILEADGPSHFPAQEGFRSSYPGVMHACGHDGHTAIGLGIAEVLIAVRAELAGTVKLIFQPGEEGGRGAVPMMLAGVVDDVDFFIGLHLGMDAPSGSIYPRVVGYLASTKLDVHFRGAPAHAGGRPQEGRNALLGAAQATLGLYAIARHSGGASRVNVGVIRGGAGRNIIADHAYMMMETRGVTSEINEYMVRRATAVIEGAALAHELEVEIMPTGSTTTAEGDPELEAVLAEAAAAVPGLKVATEPLHGGGSEDATFFMRRVQEHGGMAAYIGVGSDLPSGHHTYTFDIQEKDLGPAIAALSLAVHRLGHKPPHRKEGP